MAKGQQTLLINLMVDGRIKGMASVPHPPTREQIDAALAKVQKQLEEGQLATAARSGSGSQRLDRGMLE